ncbi:MAG: pyridoxal phosphate-dependent aminotransferase [Candidatus Zixiibacteriota bacterium]
MPNISQRGQNIPESPIRKLVPYSDAAKARGIHVYHLNIGQPDIETPKAFWDAIHSYPRKVLAYDKSQGTDGYINALVGYYNNAGIKIDRTNVLVTTGGSEAIVFAMMAITDPGDNIIVFEPFYTNYNGYATMADIKLNPVKSSPDDGYHLPPVELIEAAIDDRTRGIMICTPNNPTGTVLSRDEMENISDVVKKHDLYLISDEVYREFVYEGKHTSALHLDGLEDRAIVMDSISKRFSSCGARIGSLVTKNSELYSSFLRFAQARLCPPTIGQYGAKAILEWIDQSYFAELIGEYKKRRDIVIEELAKIDGAFCKTPEGAFYIMATLPVDDIEDFARWMLIDFNRIGKTTMFAPGPGFYASKGVGQSEARFAYVLKEDDLREAMGNIRLGLKEYQKIH